MSGLRTVPWDDVMLRVPDIGPSPKQYEAAMALSAPALVGWCTPSAFQPSNKPRSPNREIARTIRSGL